MVARSLDHPLEPVPPRLAALIRPELPSMCDEVVAEICRTIPEYSRAVRGEYADPVRASIDHAVRAFVESIADPATSTQARDEMCRTLGRLQVHFDAGLNHLDTAFRIGVRVCWRRVVTVYRRHNVPAIVQSSTADLLFGYVDELAALAREGYLDAKNNAEGQLSVSRRRLARDLLAGRFAEAAIAQTALEARWPLPEKITVVALDPTGHLDAAVLPSRVLVGHSRGRTVLLLPGEPGEGDVAALRVALGGARVVVGPAVPPAAVHHAVRWAARALTLSEDGGVPAAENGITHVDDHLLAVWLSSDPALARHIVEARLAPLGEMTAAQRARMIGSLYSWLVHNGNAVAMAEELGIHPQTARYRIRVLENALGDVLEDPEWRVSTELALRALHLRRARTRSQVRSQAG